MIVEDRADFRPIQYLGNKSRLLDGIEDVLSGLVAEDVPVCDLFAGTGVVARRLALTRPVVASDIQEYSRVLTASLLAVEVDRNALAQLATSCTNEGVSAFAELIEYEDLAIDDAVAGDPERLCEVVEAGTILRYMLSHEKRADSSLGKKLRRAADAVPTGPATVLTRYYGGLYFSFRQAVELDLLATSARHLVGPGREIALAAVMATASEIASTVGSQFAQPVQPRGRDGAPKVTLLKAVARQRRASVPDTFAQFAATFASLKPVSTGPHHVVRADYRNILAAPPRKFGAIYADPPYTRDHYSRFYHVLETIALGDEPLVSEVGAAGSRSLSRALYRADRHQSPFCIRTQAPGAFASLFEGARSLEVPIVLSYSPYSNGTVARPEPRVATIDDLVRVASKYYRQVEVRTGGSVVHSRLNRNDRNRDIDHEAEVFVVATL